MTFEIVAMPSDGATRLVAAQWSFNEWGYMYPDDSVQWYLDMYDAAHTSGNTLPICVAALGSDGSILGTASLIEDDELPNPLEPGPWVAAVFVSADARKQGIGAAMVQELVNRGRALGYDTLYLYTESVPAWYESMGWKFIRHDESLGVAVTVMLNSL